MGIEKTTAFLLYARPDFFTRFEAINHVKTFNELVNNELILLLLRVLSSVAL